MITPDSEVETCRTRRDRQRQRRAWLAELRALAEEVSVRATLSDDEAQALIDEARSIARGDRGLPARRDKAGP